MRHAIAALLIAALGCEKKPAEPEARPVEKIEQRVKEVSAKPGTLIGKLPKDGMSPTPAGEWSIVNEVRVRLIQARVAKPVLVNGRTESLGKDVELLVSVEVENVSKVKKFAYVPWCRESFGGPHVTDERGNTYGCLESPTNRVVIRGAFRDLVLDLNPGDTSVADVIRFERPVDAAKKLVVNLPAGAGDMHRLAVNEK